MNTTGESETNYQSLKSVYGKTTGENVDEKINMFKRRPGLDSVQSGVQLFAVKLRAAVSHLRLR